MGYKIATSKAPAQNKKLYRFVCEESVNSEPGDLGALQKGIGGSVSCEAIPVLVPMDVDVLIPAQPETNAQIVFTQDRPGSRFSGKGGAGDTGAGAIDIVVGRMGARATGENQLVDPNFTHDAARIYISQKTDVDINFKINSSTKALVATKESTAGVEGSKDKSAIALKADGIRIIAREGIKLVTGTDNNNSQGGAIKSIHGIDIIAGNHYKELEPMVKGKKLTDSLKKLADLVGELNAAMKHGFAVQAKFNGAIQNHFHYSPWYGNPAQPSDACKTTGAHISMEHLQQTQRSITSNRSNITAWKKNISDEFGREYICSRWNKTN